MPDETLYSIGMAHAALTKTACGSVWRCDPAGAIGARLLPKDCLAVP